MLRCLQSGKQINLRTYEMEIDGTKVLATPDDTFTLNESYSDEEIELDKEQDAFISKNFNKFFQKKKGTKWRKKRAEKRLKEKTKKREEYPMVEAWGFNSDDDEVNKAVLMGLADSDMEEEDDTSERIPYYEFLEETDELNESNMTGSGSFGTIFKGVLKSGTGIVVKVFNLKLEAPCNSFDTGCDLLRHLLHRNAVKVITRCTNLDFKVRNPNDFEGDVSLKQWVSYSVAEAVMDVVDPNFLTSTGNHLRKELDVVASIISQTLFIPHCADLLCSSSDLKVVINIILFMAILSLTMGG
ncbi:hypothetical protein FXO37_00815 [Capsicum annuum]|nr:hypothetical protein FXO37_00815 [Capsicum annuum]